MDFPIAFQALQRRGLAHRAWEDLGRTAAEGQALKLRALHGDKQWENIWLWINTYENTIFRGMNIHFNPAILM